MLHIHLKSKNKVIDEYECWLSAFDPVKKRFSGYFCGFGLEKSDSFPLDEIFSSRLNLEVDRTFKPIEAGKLWPWDFRDENLQSAT